MDTDKVLTIILSAAVGALVSLAVEYVKTRRAAEFWLAQERWKLKRETYTGLLEALAEIKRRFAILRNVMADGGKPEPDDEAMHREQQAQLLRLRIRLDGLVSVARLWLNKQAIDALQSFVDAHQTAPDVQTAGDAVKAAAGVMSKADEAIKLLTTATQRDFRLHGE